MIEKNPYRDDKVFQPYHLKRVISLVDFENKDGNIDFPSPSMVEIDLTDEGCNQSCLHCCFGSSASKKIRMIDPEILIPFLKDVYDDGTCAFELVGGGEPTAHRDISSIIDEISSFDSGINGPAHIGLVSNGVLLDRVFSNMGKQQLDWIRISLDSLDKTKYEYMHGVQGTNHYEKVLENLKFAVQIMNPSNVGIGYLVVPNINDRPNEIVRAIDFARSLGVGHIAFRPYLDYSHSYATNYDWSMIASAIEAAKLYNCDLSITGGSNGSWDFVLDPNQKPTGMCRVRPLVMVIKANGDIPQCFLYRESTEFPPFGNISNGYQMAWKNNPAHLETWQSIDMDHCPSVCKFFRVNRAVSEITKDSGENLLNSGSMFDHMHPYFI